MDAQPIEKRNENDVIGSFLDISIGRDGDPILRARQIAALHLMSQYKEFHDITVAIFRDALARDGSPWTLDHKERVIELLRRLEN